MTEGFDGTDPSGGLYVLHSKPVVQAEHLVAGIVEFLEPGEVELVVPGAGDKASSEHEYYRGLRFPVESCLTVRRGIIVIKVQLLTVLCGIKVGPGGGI